MATIAVAALFMAQGVRVSAAESETNPGVPCYADGNSLRGICVLDTESRPVCVIQFENQNCTSSN
jgi:hypothetical protein